MKILKEQKAGIIGEINGQPIRQYDDSITVFFNDDQERIQNKTIKHNNTIYYFGTSNRQKDGTYIALYWKNRPVW
jgi:hypothetical protein